MSNLLNPDAKGTVDKFLASAPDLEEAKSEPEVAEEAAEEERPPVDPIDALLMDFPKAPNRDTIENWRQHFGAVHAFIPTQNECFLFRPLRRIEYTSMAKELSRLRESPSAMEDPTIVENQTHEKVVQTCLLYPRDLISPEKLSMSPAGLFQTLFELIMRNSHFVSPEAAMAACYRL